MFHNLVSGIFIILSLEKHSVLNDAPCINVHTNKSKSAHFKNIVLFKLTE